MWGEGEVGWGRGDVMAKVVEVELIGGRHDGSIVRVEGKTTEYVTLSEYHRSTGPHFSSNRVNVVYEIDWTTRTAHIIETVPD
jgi:hypothetical protein